MDKSQRCREANNLKKQQVKWTDPNANSMLDLTDTAQNSTNYMEYNCFDPMLAAVNGSSTQFTELFCDFPVSYETTEVLTTTQFAKHGLINKPPPQPPPYNEPPPPTPPPISQLPSRDTRLQQLSKAKVSVSAPATPSRGKVVLSKKERKELSKLSKLLDGSNAMSSINLNNIENVESGNSRGRVNELRNCIAKINTKVLFGSLNRRQINDDISRDVSPPPPPAPEPNTTNFNNNDANYSEKLKNLPVRQRKAHTSHMDNYCLFDPVDFINEKALRQRKCMNVLRDPLFSSRQNLEFPDEELVPEIIYDNKEQEEIEAEENYHNNYAHHNYFVIDPDELEREPNSSTTCYADLPNAESNKQYEETKSAKNLEQTKITVNPPTALVESSSSSVSVLTSSSTSATSSSQATLQRAKKKLTFLSLSPFRSQSPKNSQTTNKDLKDNVERAVSELVSSDHILHLQQMLFHNKDNMRSRTVPIESNYVLFNPGPVPSRNVPYKVRKPRPLSTNSDADSGFLSPCSPDDMSTLKSNPSILVLQQCDSVQGYLEVSLINFDI